MQFSADDVGIEDAVRRAVAVDVDGVPLSLATVVDLLVLKLAAAEEPRRRSSKRRRDLLDVITLAEEHPDAASTIPNLTGRVEKLAAAILTIGG